VVYAAGEEWTARSASGADIPSGERVLVMGQDGLTLIVGSGVTGSMPGSLPGQEARP
jgi:membrane-bound ClpP family serine protease